MDYVPVEACHSDDGAISRVGHVVERMTFRLTPQAGNDADCGSRLLGGIERLKADLERRPAKAGAEARVSRQRISGTGQPYFFRYSIRAGTANFFFGWPGFTG